MKLVYPDYTYQMNFEEGKANIVVIESKREFRHLLEEILMQIEGNDGRFVLSDNDEILKISTNMQCVIDPFALNLNNRKILDKIYALCKQEVLETELFLELEQLYSNIYAFMEKVLEKIDYSITYTDEIDIKLLFKLVNLRLQSDSYDFLEKIIDYIKISHTLLGNRIFVFSNLRSYLESSELELLYKQMSYEKIFLLLIESQDVESISDCETKYIIDKDCCEIY